MVGQYLARSGVEILLKDIDKANDTSTDTVEKYLTIFNLEAGRSGEFSLGGVV